MAGVVFVCFIFFFLDSCSEIRRVVMVVVVAVRWWCWLGVGRVGMVGYMRGGRWWMYNLVGLGWV